MTSEQARKHNEAITEKVKELQGQYISRYKIKVIERLQEGRRQVVDEITTDYTKESDTKALYQDYRNLYDDKKKYFVLIDKIDDVKRIVKIALPTRTDADRQPGISDPSPEQMGE